MSQRRTTNHENHVPRPTSYALRPTHYGVRSSEMFTKHFIQGARHAP